LGFHEKSSAPSAKSPDNDAHVKNAQTPPYEMVIEEATVSNVNIGKDDADAPVAVVAKIAAAARFLQIFILLVHTIFRFVDLNLAAQNSSEQLKSYSRKLVTARMGGIS
jgi:hypothetical protein